MLPRRHFRFACNGRLADTGAQGEHLLQFRQRRQFHQDRQKIIDSLYRKAVAIEDRAEQNQDEPTCETTGSISIGDAADKFDDLTRSFVRLSNLPTYPLDRLSRYELWCEACQIPFALQYLDRRKQSHGTSCRLERADEAFADDSYGCWGARCSVV